MKTALERLVSVTGRWMVLLAVVLAVGLASVGAGLSGTGKSPASLIDRVKADGL